MFMVYLLMSPPEIWWHNITNGFHSPIDSENAEKFLLKKSESLWIVPGTVDPSED